MNMNVWGDNDYQQTRMKKVIIIQCPDLNFSQQFEAELPYDYQSRELDLGYPLSRILTSVPTLNMEEQVFYFHPFNQHYVYAGVFPFKSPLIIGEDFINTSQITVRIRKLSEVEEIEDLAKQSKDDKSKKRKVDRTIKEVLMKVSQWRELSQKTPKITLEEAAKVVDIPKKTLDDYFMHIKIASEHNFDFQINLNEKIGVLRKFVKDKHTKRKQSQLQFLPSILKRQFDSQEQQEQE